MVVVTISKKTFVGGDNKRGLRLGLGKDDVVRSPLHGCPTQVDDGVPHLS